MDSETISIFKAGLPGEPSRSSIHMILDSINEKNGTYLRKL